MIDKASRYFTLRAAQLWISGLAYLRGLCRSIARAIASLVDSHTGGSHPRYPITLERISNEAGCSVATVCRHIPELEAAGIVKVTRFPPRRLADGTVRQEPNDYELLLPDERWREIAPVESTPAARVPAPSVPEPAPVEPTSRWSRSVQGMLSTRDASTRRSSSWQLDAAEDVTFVDGMSAAELAPKLLEVAMLQAEGTSDDLRHRVVVCLNELRAKAHDVALLMTNSSLSSWNALSCVRQWVAKTLQNASQRVDSAEHGLNILRKFVRAYVHWTYEGKGRDRVLERAEQRRRDEGGDVAPRARVRIEHIAIRKL
jgi:hypothetical protein